MCKVKRCYAVQLEAAHCSVGWLPKRAAGQAERRQAAAVYKPKHGRQQVVR